ncbi:2-hydroxychromene-2-carboxylate isomerase [Hyaloraphidium curvatum]|nr:2-hydroxychromene-2-carboxylate isomerase [Hyaloraphidium curvatum]
MAPGSDVSVEVFFDCSSPWTYMLFHNLLRSQARMGYAVAWRPFVVGFVFNEVNRKLYEDRSNPPVPRKAEYSMKDMMDWAALAELELNFPPKCGHPVNAVKCMRACVAVQLAKGDEAMVRFAKEAFHALWVEGRDFAKEDVLRDIAKRAEIDGDWVIGQLDKPEVKEGLKRNSDEVIARNAFGSPTIYVEKTDMYFGNDRLVLVEAAIRRERKKKGIDPERGVQARM